jgi:hypothetical protein
MGERNHESSTPEAMEDLFEPALGDIPDEILQELTPMSTERQLLVKKRRLAEQRLEEKRLRDELGDYDLHLDYN